MKLGLFLLDPFLGSQHRQLLVKIIERCPSRQRDTWQVCDTRLCRAEFRPPLGWD